MVEGTTTIKNEVLVKIAVAAAQDVPGIDQVGASSVGRSIASAFGAGRSSTTGIGVKPGQPGSGEASFQLTISTQYGFSIPDIARQVRQSIGQRIKDTAGIDVNRVDIHIEDIKEPRGDGLASRIPFIGGGEEREEAGEEQKAQARDFTEVPRSA